MKKTRYLLLVSLLLASCDWFPFLTGSDTATNTPTVTDSLSPSISVSESSQDTSDIVLENDDYFWPFSENGIINSDYKFGVSSMDEDSDFTLKVDDVTLGKDSKTNFDSILYYDTLGCNSDNVNNAYDCFYLNGTKLGKFKADGSQGMTFSIDDLNFGDNIFTVTIGKYWSTYEYDYTTKNQGLCDDFQVGNFRLLTSTGLLIKCHKMVFYKNVYNTTQYKQYTVIPEDDKLYWIGDGYSGDKAYDGHTNPLRDIPQKIDFYLSFDLPEAISTYTLDTSKYSDGLHKVSLYDGKTLVRQNHIIIDNNAPTLECNIEEFEQVNVSNKTLEIKLSDQTTSVVSSKILVDGVDIYDETLETPFNFKDLKVGLHNVSVSALDSAGNQLHNTINFNVVESTYNEKAKTEIKATLFEENDTSKIYKIDTKGASELTLNLNASSQENEKICVYALNQTSKEYDLIANGVSSKDIKVSFATANYASNDEVFVKVEANYYGNGSNKIYWTSDTQYFPKVEFTDINADYAKLMNYYKNGINNGDACYLVHTGDLVDNHPGYEEDAVAEWNIATAAFEILDKNNIPYGTCAGNHDVGSTLDSIDYIYYSEFFNVERINKSEYIGGIMNNNQCHYDLISVGKYDFIFLYIGFGIEANSDTIAWCNKVLSMYSHRNAIICTHAYLTSDGKLDDQAQANQIHDYIVVPNQNVKFVFCGHTDGSVHNKKTEDGHTFYEILNCYQFVQKETYSVDHTINGYKCNGEGYMKDVTFADDGTVSFSTYSPLKSKKNPLSSNDSFTLTGVDLIANGRTLTVNSFAIYK